MKRKNYTPLYAVLQAMVWGGFGIVISYAVPYFEALGMDDGLSGLLLAAVSLLSFFAQLGLGELCSRFKRLTLKRLLVALGALMAVCCIALFSLPMELPLLCVLFCLIALIVQVLPSSVNALGMAGLADGLSINFGVARGIGSASFAVCSFLTGRFFDSVGEHAVPILHIVIAVLLITAALLFPRVSTAPQTEEKKAKDHTSLWKNGRLILVLVGATLLYVSHNCLCNYLNYVAERCGGGKSEQGVCLAIAAFCELPVMFLFTKMLKIKQGNFWLKLSGLFMGLRVLGCFLAPNVGWLYGVQFFQLLGFALFSVASVIYFNSLVDTKDTVRAQAMLASTCTLSNIIAFLLGAALIDRFGISAVLLISIVCAAAGTALLLIFAKKPRRTAGAGTEVPGNEKEEN